MYEALHLSKISYKQLKSLIPVRRYFSLDPDRWNSEKDFFSRYTIWFHDGDLTIPHDFGTGLYDGPNMLVVKGNLEVEGVLGGTFFVQGGLRAQGRVTMSEDHQTVQGDPHIQYFEALYHADDGALFALPAAHRTTAPFVFCYYVDLRTLHCANKPIVWDVKDTDDYAGTEIDRDNMLWIKGSWGPLLFVDDIAWSDVSWLTDSAWKISENFLLPILKQNTNPFAFAVSKDMLSRYAAASKLHADADWDAARAELLALAAAYPDFYFPHFHLGAALADMGAYREAIVFLDKATTVFPTQLRRIVDPALEYLAQCHMRMGEIDQAERYADVTLAKFGGSFRANLVKAEALFARGKLVEAIPYALEAEKRRWNASSPPILLAMIHQRLGNEEESLRWLAQARNVSPELTLDLAKVNSLDFLFATLQ